MNTVPFAKSTLKEALLAALDGEIASALNAARQAQETASHEGNKPENQYDTLALEAAYLAHGQSERIRELQETRILIGQWPVQDFSEDDSIASGALIQLLDTQSKSAAAKSALVVDSAGWRPPACDRRTHYRRAKYPGTAGANTEAFEYWRRSGYGEGTLGNRRGLVRAGRA